MNMKDTFKDRIEKEKVCLFVFERSMSLVEFERWVGRV